MATHKPLSCLIAAAAFAIAQSAGAVGLPNVPNTHTGKFLPDTPDVGAALTSGKPDVWLRLRYEDVSDEIPAGSPIAGTGDADLLSLRGVLGYTTARFNGFYGRVELEANARIGDDNALNVDEDLTFPPGPGGSRIAAGHSVIADNNFQEVNEAYIGWRSPKGGCPNAPASCNGQTSFKLGRQTIIYDNHRWVGNIVWRQNHQSYDAFRVDNTSIPNLSLSYVYVDQVNRTFGADSAFNKWKMTNTHLLNGSYKFPFGKLIGDRKSVV